MTHVLIVIMIGEEDGTEGERNESGSVFVWKERARKTADHEPLVRWEMAHPASLLACCCEKRSS